MTSLWRCTGAALVGVALASADAGRRAADPFDFFRLDVTLDLIEGRLRSESKSVLSLVRARLEAGDP